MVIQKTGKYANMQVFPKLQAGLDEVFLKMPNLSFVAANSTQHYGGSDTPEDLIHAVYVYDGNQRVGNIVWEKRYTRSGYVYCYRVRSPKIETQRGDSHTKRTESINSLVNLVKKYFVTDTKDTVAKSIVSSMYNSINTIVWHAARPIEDISSKHSRFTFQYVLRVFNGESPTLDPKFVQDISNEKFKKSFDDNRITNAVVDSFRNQNGAVVRIEKDETLTFIDLKDYALSEIKSTYDLPKNYQEKLTILKVMDYNAPIDGVGVKVKTVVYEEECTLFYLVGGDTIVTH